jgi:hypothetical protein
VEWVEEEGAALVKDGLLWRCCSEKETYLCLFGALATFNWIG